MPKISFIVSAYKCERFLDHRLRNLFCEQTDDDSEVIVVDSASPEAESDIVQKWQTFFPDRVKYIKQSERTNYGVSWLEGWKIAEGELCCNANADDLLSNAFTRKVYDAYRQSLILGGKPIAFIYTGIQVVDENGRGVAAGQRPPFDRNTNSYECHQGPSVAWATNLRYSLDWDLMYKRANEYKSAFDYWLWLYFMSLGFDGLAVPDILTIYLQRKDSIENSNKHENNYETYSAISEFFPHNFNSHLKHAKEFSDFTNLPPRDEWIATMQAGKKWRN